MKVITLNRKAYHDYHIFETVEAGLALVGTEIKAIREGRINIREAYARGEKGELWLFNAHISQYSHGNVNNHEPTRRRKLLLHKDQIAELLAKVEQKGFTIVPLKLYVKDHVAKIELGLAKGRRQYDKRQVIAQREADVDMRRALKETARQR